MSGINLYLTQRITALIMIPLVFGHLATMIYAIGGGLSAGEILLRTQGSIFWGLFYSLFVLAATIHGAIGLRTLLLEYIQIDGIYINIITIFIASGFLVLGASAVIAVTFS